MASQLATRPGLSAEGARIGAEFRLGPCTGAWSGRRYSGRLGAGAILLLLVLCGGIIGPLDTIGAAREISGGLVAAVVAWGILLIVLPPRSWTDRLFACQAGMVLLDVRAAEPQVLRWAQLESLTVTLGSSYENYFLSACVLRDRAGNALTVPRHLKAAFPGVVAAAERVLAPRLVPDLLARLDAGVPVTVGGVTADLYGLSLGTGLSWREVRAVEFELQGQHGTVKTGRRAKDNRNIAVEDQPNSFLLRYLIAHVGAAVGFPVTGHAAHWDGETPYDPEATVTASTLPAPGMPQAIRAPEPEPEPEPERTRKRHPARTAFLAAVVIGIIAGVALTFYHGGVILPPCSGDSCDSGDHIASLWALR